MAVRYPLIVDTTDNNKIKELPSGDSLNLSGNNIVNVVNVTASGTLTVQNLVVESTTFTVDGNSLNSVAFTGSYTDLSNTPTLFDGVYASLTGKPTIPANIEDLANVGSTSPANGEILIYDSTLGRYEPGTIDASFDAQFQDQNIDNLNNVVFTGDKTNDVLKFVDGIWKNERVDFDELTGTLNVVQQGDTLTGSLIGDVKGSVFADDSTLLVDGVGGTITGTISSINWMAASDSYLTISNGGSTGPGPIQIVASANLDLSAGAGQVINANRNIVAAEGVTGNVTGDVIGSVFADDSTLLVDGVNGEIPGYVKIADLKTALQDGAGDYAAFKAWVLANL
jgi:hypothetical protein